MKILKKWLIKNKKLETSKLTQVRTASYRDYQKQRIAIFEEVLTSIEKIENGNKP